VARLRSCAHRAPWHPHPIRTRIRIRIRIGSASAFAVQEDSSDTRPLGAEQRRAATNLLIRERGVCGQAGGSGSGDRPMQRPGPCARAADQVGVQDVPRRRPDLQPGGVLGLIRGRESG
jgi:hypothetical protein